MRKLLLSIAVCSMLFGVGCSQPNEKGPENPDGKVVVKISATSELESRTRFYAEDRTDRTEVEEVDLWIFKEDAEGNFLFQFKTNMVPWDNTYTEIEYELQGPEKLEPGNYKFFAVGRETGDNFLAITPQKDVTDFDEVTAAVVDAETEVSEIFAGSKEEEVTSHGVTVEVEMTRQVAGVLAYITNVPQQYELAGEMRDVKSLVLRVSAYNSTLNLTTSVGSNTTNEWYDLITFDLTQQTDESDADLYFDGNTSERPSDVVTVPNAQLKGQFVLPIATASMRLVLMGGDNGDVELKTWEVVLKDGDNKLVQYPLLANYVYRLGRKTNATDTNGEDGQPGTDDDDEGIDLSASQDVTITLDVEWAGKKDLDLF